MRQASGEVWRGKTSKAVRRTQWLTKSQNAKGRTKGKPHYKEENQNSRNWQQQKIQ